MSHTPTHTPTPWKYREGWECYQLCSANGMPIGLTDYPSDGRNIFREEAEANAAHIVRCINVHDQLVEALRLVDEKLGHKFNSELSDIVDEALAAAEKGA